MLIIKLINVLVHPLSFLQYNESIGYLNGQNIVFLVKKDSILRGLLTYLSRSKSNRGGFR